MIILDWILMAIGCTFLLIVTDRIVHIIENLKQQEKEYEKLKNNRYS